MAYAVVAVLRLQHASQRRSLLLPCVNTFRAKEQGEVLEAAGAILGEISATPLKDNPFENRVLRIRTDRG